MLLGMPWSACVKKPPPVASDARKCYLLIIDERMADVMRGQLLGRVFNIQPGDLVVSPSCAAQDIDATLNDIRTLTNH